MAQGGGARGHAARHLGVSWGVGSECHEYVFQCEIYMCCKDPEYLYEESSAKRAYVGSFKVDTVFHKSFEFRNLKVAVTICFSK